MYIFMAQIEYLYCYCGYPIQAKKANTSILFYDGNNVGPDIIYCPNCKEELEYNQLLELGELP